MSVLQFAKLSTRTLSTVLMVDSSPIAPLPAGVRFQPMVVQSEEVNVNHFRIFFQNESKTETLIPEGTVIGHM